MFKQRALSPEQALQKLRHYCDYQERCHREVREKLYSFGLHRDAVENAIATLIEEDRLNEERFALLFAGGRFRLKHWGRVKIRYALKQKQVSEYTIKKALASLDEDDYAKTLTRQAEAKWEMLGGESDKFARRRKLQDYLLQKGYEPDLIAAAVNSFTARTE